jgi:hypothetical protein
MVALARRHGSSLRDFVPGNFPEPHNPIWQGRGPADADLPSLADFVDANFPEPHNPIWQAPGSMGSIGCGGSCGGGCADCGMGALSVPAWALTLPAPLNGSMAGFPTVYWIAGGLAAVVVLPMLLGRRGRR